VKDGNDRLGRSQGIDARWRQPQIAASRCELPIRLEKLLGGPTIQLIRDRRFEGRLGGD
jgi:hypothetical protein